MESKEKQEERIIYKWETIFEHATEETHNNLLDVAFWKDYYLKNKEYTQLSFLDLGNNNLELATETETLNFYVDNQINKCKETEALLNEVIYPYIKENNKLPFLLIMGDNPEEAINRANSIEEKLYNFARIEEYTERELNLIFAHRKDLYSIFKTKRQKKYIKEKQQKEEATEKAIQLREETNYLYNFATGPQIRDFVKILHLTNIDNETAKNFITSDSEGNRYSLTIDDNQVFYRYHAQNRRGNGTRDYMVGYTSYIRNPEEAKIRNASKNKLVKFFVYFMSKIKKILSYSQGEEKELLETEGKIKITYEEIITAGIFDNFLTAELEMRYINDILLHLFMSLTEQKGVKQGAKISILTAYRDTSKAPNESETNPDSKGYKNEGQVIIYQLANKQTLWQILGIEMKSPNWIYTLSNNAFILVYNLFNYARVNNRNSFNYYYETIQNILGLKKREETEHPKRDIKEPILKAIEEINQTAEKNKKGNNPDIIIIPMDKEANIKKFLEEGRAKIIIKNEDIIAFNDSMKVKAIEQKERNVKK